MKYVIEGTIKELKKENKVWSFKIAGTDDYASRQKKGKEEIRKNVLCLESTRVKDNKKPKNAIALEESTMFVIPTWEDIDKEYFHLLSLALANGKKCRICFLVKDKKLFDSNNCNISSLTLLAW